MRDVTGAVLAGGGGKRLGGVRKAFLRKDGVTLLERTLGLYRAIFADALVVANEAGVYETHARVVSDPIADRGAPGGLFAALSGARTPWVFLAACDMPALDRRVIEALATRRPALDAVVVRIEGRAEPLHAFWSVAAKGVLERLLRDGEPSFRDLLKEIPHASIELADLEREVPGAGASFANVNTPEDLARFGIELPSAGR